MSEKFHFDRLRNDRSLIGNGKPDNNKKKNAWRSDSGLKVDAIIAVMSFPCRNTQKSISDGVVRSIKTPCTGELKTLPRCLIWFHWAASWQEGMKGVGTGEERTGQSGGRDDEWEGRMRI